MVNNLFFIAAGEVSGDIHAADLMRRIKGKKPDISFTGMGGQNMIKAGLNSIDSDITYYGTIGLSDSLRFYNKNNQLYKKSIEYLKRNPVTAAILVDNQGLNIPRAKFLKKKGIKCFYYFPPHVSIWGRWYAPLLAKNVDYLIVPHFPDYLVYREYTKNVLYSGNPILDKVYDFKISKDFFDNNGLVRDKKIVAIMPGSRFQEVETLLPPFLEASEILINRYDIQIILPVSHPIYEDYIINKINEFGLSGKIKLIREDSYSAMSVSDVVILSSGTASLESVLFGKPPVICYKVSSLSFFIGKMLVKSDVIGLPNIILNKKVFPELLQKDCNSGNIIRETLSFLNLTGQKKLEFESYYAKIKTSLGERPVVDKVADFILKNTFSGGN